jgi:hypothetical protein
MMRVTAIGMAAASLLAIATGSASAQSKAKGTEMRQWTVTHGGSTSQKKAGVLKAKTPKAKISGEVFVKFPAGSK